MADGCRIQMLDKNGGKVAVPFRIDRVTRNKGTYAAASFGKLIVQDSTGKYLEPHDLEGGKEVYIQFTGTPLFESAVVC